jgi:hypothetical protein
MAANDACRGRPRSVRPCGRPRRALQRLSGPADLTLTRVVWTGLRRRQGCTSSNKRAPPLLCVALAPPLPRCLLGSLWHLLRSRWVFGLLLFLSGPSWCRLPIGYRVQQLPVDACLLVDRLVHHGLFLRGQGMTSLTLLGLPQWRLIST